MVLGIDVGGTYSDAVLISEKRILKRLKIKTNQENLIQSITEIRDSLGISEKNSPDKIIVSTTLMTNFITEKKYENTGLLLIPGPGMKYTSDIFPFPFEILSGGIDFQGRIFEKINKKEVLEKVEKLKATGIQRISINGKFSPRNPIHEQEVYEIIKENFPELILEKGIELSGNLNIIRRAISSGLKMSSEDIYTSFLKSLNDVFFFCKEKYILKSDGGAVSFDQAKKYAIETIFSGPAASSFGALALLKDIVSAVVIDIGGTTSDFSLILNNEPLFATKGIKINNFYTTARGISIYSLPLGGDTKIDFDSGNFSFSMRKIIPAMNGGEDLTISDCLCYLDKIDIGSKILVANILEEKAIESGKTPDGLAEEILTSAGLIISDTLNKVIKIWEEEPKYKVWQIENGLKIHPDQIYLIGGPAKGFQEYIEKASKIPVIVDEQAMTANALGAALAKVSFNTYVRINTAKNEVSTGWGFLGKTNFSKKVHPDEIKEYSIKIVEEYLNKLNIREKPIIFEHEIFSMVKGGYTEGQIHELQIGLKTGLNPELFPLEGGE